MKKLRNKKGFTLAELLVVVTIIAILVAIAIPVFNAATTRATNAVIVANGRACKAEALIDYISKGTTSDSNIVHYYHVDKQGNIASGSSDPTIADGWAYEVTIEPDNDVIVQYKDSTMGDYDDLPSLTD